MDSSKLVCYNAIYKCFKFMMQYGVRCLECLEAGFIPSNDGRQCVLLSP